MVRLKGPGMGQEASGSIADTVTFSKCKGVSYLKLHAKPANPKTQPQVSVRTVTQLIATDWRNFTANEKDTWAALAARNNVSPYNACLAYNLTQWAHFLFPSRTYPPTRTGTNHLFSEISVVPHGRGALWTYAVTDMRDGWTMALHVVPAPGGTATYQNCIRMMAPTAPGTITWLWSPLDPGTYNFRAVGTTTSGKAAIPGGNRSVVIP